MEKRSESLRVPRKFKMREGLLPRKPKALAFDFDGTIVDSVDYMASTWIQLAQSVGIDPHVDVRELVGMTGSQIARILAGGDEALIARIVATRRQYFDVDRYIKNVKLFPESASVLAELKQSGRRMALASSTTTGRIQTMATAFGVDRCFDVVVGGDEVARSKPAPDLIKEAAKRLNVSANALAYVGDTRYDVEAAIKAKAMAVLVFRGRKEYSGPEPHLLVRDLTELLLFV